MVKAYEGYFELLGSIERLHRLMLDVIKDEFEQLRNVQVNSVQALLLFNIGEDQVTPGELRSRGYYQGSNVSYNVKKLVEGGFLEQERNEKDRRSVLLRLTQKGREIHDIVAGLHLRHAKAFTEMIGDEIEKIEVMRKGMRELELYWRGQIRYIY
ncbi:MAG: MarR family winged helix-turn-helix transcriptional regulator [Neomegalonema sp.]|nr:MarR family winged helix-turn-helix transcriptional regulator [Neomegalonema sp.]